MSLRFEHLRSVECLKSCKTRPYVPGSPSGDIIEGHVGVLKLNCRMLRIECLNVSRSEGKPLLRMRLCCRLSSRCYGGGQTPSGWQESEPSIISSRK